MTEPAATTSATTTSATPPSVHYALVTGEFVKSLTYGFVDRGAAPDSDIRYRPRFVTNSPKEARSLLQTLQSLLRGCQSFDFSVAFITAGGITSLLETLREMRRHGIPGRILTTTYNNFNDPDALRKLLAFPNIQLRVFQGDLHTKGYLFHNDGYSTIIIGSSNLTQKALQVNKEWNILLHSMPDGEMLENAKTEFDGLWNDPLTTEISEAWIDEYERYRTVEDKPKAQVKPAFVATETALSALGRDLPEFVAESCGTPLKITPNRMQAGALDELAKIHQAGEARALLISATGTGKTYLAAFEVQQAKPKRVLFIAHRERILSESLKSFRRVLGDGYTYEIYGAGSRTPQASCVFAMIGTLRRHLEEFEPATFDYIIVDEAHHVGASGYQAVMGYFTPAFWLGMTATPNRTDGYDVFALFNHTIAYRISLQDALENDMLVPFHYFGIADLAIDDEMMDDPSAFALLTSEERVKHVTQKIEEYSVERTARKGLIFCSRNEEAAKLSELFNKKGYRTIALSGADDDDERASAIAKLERGDIEYIFTVDIFNEGIDIPVLNQIIMLRRTESAIVFVQQLGRGLRKLDGKEFTLVLDFIGNYQKNFLVPIALSGDRTYNKDNLRRFVKEGSLVIPGCSTISFDRISEARVMRAIDGGKFSEARLIREEYANLKQELGRIPGLLDFDANQSIDPLIILNKYGSYHAFLDKYDKDYDVAFTGTQEAILKFVSQKLAQGKRLEDLLLLRRLLDDEVIERPEFGRYVAANYAHMPTDETMESVFGMLAGAFSSAEGIRLIEIEDGLYTLSALLEKALVSEEFGRQLREVLDFGIGRYNAGFATAYKDTNLVLNAKYTYEDVCRLLNWPKNVNGQNIGGYKYDAATNTFPVFINYEKAPDISDTIRYEDRFESERSLIAISKGKRYMTSPEIRRLMKSPENGMRTYLFVRKNKNDGDGGKEFYFLGEMYPTQEYREIVRPETGDTVVEIRYELDVPVRPDLYDYITSDLNDTD